MLIIIRLKFILLKNAILKIEFKLFETYEIDKFSILGNDVIKKWSINFYE
jgi:hypothetical protein